MSLPITLSIARLISVNVTLTTQAAQAQSVNSCLLLGSTPDVIDTVKRIRSYATIGAVSADFGTSAPEYLAATLWFEQNPQPGQLFIGRWAAANTHGHLICAPLTAAQQVITVWNAITNGSFHVAIDGAAPQSLTGLNFSGAANMNAVAAIISAALVGATCTWNAVYSYFDIRSNSSGPASSVSFLTAGTGGTDISGTMGGLTSTTSGVYQVAGLVAESALTAATLFDTKFGQQWYGLVVLGAVDADHAAIAPFIEGSSNRHFYGATTTEAGVLVSGDTGDIAAVLKTTGYNHTAVQYSSTNPYAVVSLLARILTTDYTQNSSVISLMYKQEPGIAAENLDINQVAALEAKNCNVFVAYNNNTAIIEQGVTTSGQFIDTVIGADALALTIQTALYNLLFTSPTKIPQTDSGTHQLVTTITQVCAQFVNDGLLAPGVWNGQAFGALQPGQNLSKGYYIYAAPMSQQTQANRAARLSPPIQIAAKLAGAVHEANVAITVNP